MDETGFLKKGDKSAGVRRRYSGTAGRVENCQVGVFLAFAGRRGRALLDREPYLPKGWVADAGRMKRAGAPAGTAFATKPRLAERMAARRGGRAAWVAGDAGHGSGGTGRRSLEATGQPYVLAVYVELVRAAARPGARVRLALKAGTAPAAAHVVALAQAGCELFAVKPGAAEPEYGLLSLAAGGVPGPRSAGFHWGEPRSAAWDAETHRRDLWWNRSAAALAGAAERADAWFAAHATPVRVGEMLRSAPDCVVHAFPAGQPVRFAPLFTRSKGEEVASCRLQDPYLLTDHQLRCLTDFLHAAPWSPARPVAVQLRTRMTDGDPKKKEHLPPLKQRAELAARLQAASGAPPALDVLAPRFGAMHMRYAHFTLAGGGERLFIFERGLDMADPANGGKSRGDSYVLEFHAVPKGLEALLGPRD